VFNERLKTALENRQNIIINNTNLRYQYREMFFNKAKENNYETRLYYINRPYEKLLEARPGDNWKKVIDRMIASFDIPNKNEALIYKEWDEELINYLIKYASND
jgi:predicted kinase